MGTLPIGAPRTNQGHDCAPCPIHLGLVGMAWEGGLSVLSPLPEEATVGAGTCPRSLGHPRASSIRGDQNPVSLWTANSMWPLVVAQRRAVSGALCGVWSPTAWI